MLGLLIKIYNDKLNYPKWSAFFFLKIIGHPQKHRSLLESRSESVAEMVRVS